MDGIVPSEKRASFSPQPRPRSAQAGRGLFPQKISFLAVIPGHFPLRISAENSPMNPFARPLPVALRRHGEIVGIVLGTLNFPLVYYAGRLETAFVNGPAAIFLPIVMLSAAAGFLGCSTADPRRAPEIAGVSLRVGVRAGIVASLISGGFAVLASTFHAFGFGYPSSVELGASVLSVLFLVTDSAPHLAGHSGAAAVAFLQPDWRAPGRGRARWRDARPSWPAACRAAAHRARARIRGCAAAHFHLLPLATGDLLQAGAETATGTGGRGHPLPATPVPAAYDHIRL